VKTFAQRSVTQLIRNAEVAKTKSRTTDAKPEFAPSSRLKRNSLATVAIKLAARPGPNPLCHAVTTTATNKSEMAGRIRFQINQVRIQAAATAAAACAYRCSVPRR
jgi:hypothetical protein